MSRDSRQWRHLYQTLKVVLGLALLITVAFALIQSMTQAGTIKTSQISQAFPNSEQIEVPDALSSSPSPSQEATVDHTNKPEVIDLAVQKELEASTLEGTAIRGDSIRDSNASPRPHLKDSIEEYHVQPAQLPKNKQQTHATSSKMANLCRRGRSVAPADFGAMGDGLSDDTLALRSALEYGNACSATVVIGPQNAKFLVSPGAMKLALHNVVIRFEGTLLGPPLDAWNPEHASWPTGFCAFGETDCTPNGVPSPEAARSWWNLLHLENSSNVTIRGPGGLQAPGQTFWTVRNKKPAVRGYCLFKVENSRFMRILGLRLIDSPMYHLVITHSRDVKMEGLNISAKYETSSCGARCKIEARNTDGVSIIASSYVSLRNSSIESGDDNLVIKGGSHFVRADGLRLYRGKGLAIGSLGERGVEDLVTDIVLRNVTANNCHYGLRVKTWQGGRGMLRNVTAEFFTLHEVKVGINIDQTYCASTQLPGGCAGKSRSGAVGIKDVHIRNFSGTYWKEAKNIQCVECSGITYERVHLKKAPKTATNLTATKKTKKLPEHSKT